jgi:hypothetical protein
MPYTFVNGDLHLTQERIDQLTQACANNGILTPVERAIEEATAKVEGMTASYLLPEARWRNLVRVLARFNLFTAADALSETEEKAHVAAIRELEAIRDGKEPTLPAATTAPTLMSAGAWGSATKLTLR